MKFKRFISAAMSVLLMVITLSGCNQAAPPEAANTPTEQAASPDPSENTGENAGVTVTDMVGKVITLDKPAERIVALIASDCEILYSIGAGDRIIGRGEYCDYPSDIQNLPMLQSGQNTNTEQIMSFDPDVVIIGKDAQPEEVLQVLDEAGIKVVTTNSQKIEDVYVCIELLGILTGKTDEADALVRKMKSSFAEIASKVGEGTGKTVYFEVSPLEYGLWTAGKNTFMDEMAEILKVTNVFDDVDGWAEVSEEAVIDRNPDHIVSITMYFGEGVNPVDEILGRNGWQNMTAIENKAVLNADSDEISRPGPRLVDAINTLYSFFYE